MCERPTWSPVPLAICEVCGVVWGIVIVAGTAYLTEWRGWSGWSWVGALLLIALWTCKWDRYPGTEDGDHE